MCLLYIFQTLILIKIITEFVFGESEYSLSFLVSLVFGNIKMKLVCLFLYFDAFSVCKTNKSKTLAHQ